MPQSLAKISIHLVFSTKGRTPWLRSNDLRDQLYSYMAVLLRDNLDSPAIIIGGIEDHVHILFSMSRKFSIMDIVKGVKTETSKWLKKQGGVDSTFAWQSGYGAFSVSESNIQQVREYIARQPEHHRKQSFQDEFRELCRRHNLPLDERYVWH